MKHYHVQLPKALPFTPLYQSSQAFEIGQIVSVPFGNSESFGVVWQEAANDTPLPKTIRQVNQAIDLPSITPKLMTFIEWVANYTLTPTGNILKMTFSAAGALDPEKPLVYYHAANPLPEGKLTTKQERLLEYLAEHGPSTLTDIHQNAGLSRDVIMRFAQKGGLTAEEKYPEEQKDHFTFTLPTLSKAQQHATDQLIQTITENTYSTTVIDGVTGSGKTEVYARALAHVLENDPEAQVLILLPEIALTSSILLKLEERFGARPALWHSELTPATRKKTWRRIATGHARVIIGARSALFLPYKKLSLIVIDEEHDHSFKQEDGVMYHARDMAVMYAHLLEIPVFLCSATPSLETISNVEKGKYRSVHLPSRFGEAVMPEIRIIDMRKEKQPKTIFLSQPLRHAIETTYHQEKQSLLFLNRRGYAPLTLCRNCGHRFTCTECSSWLVMHKSGKRLNCHHCGYHEPLPPACPECGETEKLAACGPGVERIEEEVHALLPDANVMILTSDHSGNPAVMQEKMRQIQEKEVDIIIGTQIIAKGHHFPSLTLVGIIDADLGLSGGDLRAAERSYQLLQQVAGRAGREKDKGTVLIQSYMPENAVIQALAKNDRDAFIASEMDSRKLTHMPPFAKLVAIIISGKDAKHAEAAARNIAQAAPTHPDIQLLGPVPAPLFRLRSQYRFRILLRSKRDIAVQKWLKSWLDQLDIPRNIKVKIDVDPYGFQ